VNQLSGGAPSLQHHSDVVAFGKRHHKQHSSEAENECCLVLGRCLEWFTEDCVQRRELWFILKTFPNKIKMTLGKGRQGSVSLMSAVVSTAVFIEDFTLDKKVHIQCCCTRTPTPCKTPVICSNFWQATPCPTPPRLTTGATSTLMVHLHEHGEPGGTAAAGGAQKQGGTKGKRGRDQGHLGRNKCPKTEG